MARYGFSNRWAVSPFSSQDGVPHVTDEDYSYITSADLDDHGVNIPRPYHSPSRFDNPFSHSAPSVAAYDRLRPEDDVLLIKHHGITYPEHFPAYSIGDGKLLVSDVRERIKMILDLSDRQAKGTKLYYKGRRLKRADIPVCEYGVKNNSEILMVPGDAVPGNSSESSEEVVVVGRDGRERYETQGNSPRLGRSGRFEDRSPRESGSQVGLEVPAEAGRRRAVSRVRTQSPGSAASASSAPPAAPVGIPGGPIERLNNLAAEFNTKCLPLLADYVARPPLDDKKRVDEYNKINEMSLQLLIKIDDVTDASTEPGGREMKKALVVEIQRHQAKLDAAKDGRR